MKDIRQSKNYADYLSSIGWEVVKKNNIYYFIKKFLFLTTIKLQRPERIDDQVISELVKNQIGIINFIIEPSNNSQLSSINDQKFKRTNPYLPSKTLILDLSKSEKDIYHNFAKDTKYSIRKVENCKLKIVNCESLSNFHRKWKNSVPFSRVVLPLENLRKLKKAFGKKALFLLSENGGGIFLVANNTGYYWQAFTNPEGRKSLVQYSIVWEGIKWCKARGAKYFDFEGIYDERFPLEKWKGFTSFKKKFGGKEVEYKGAYQKWFINL